MECRTVDDNRGRYEQPRQSRRWGLLDSLWTAFVRAEDYESYRSA